MESSEGTSTESQLRIALSCMDDLAYIKSLWKKLADENKLFAAGNLDIRLSTIVRGLTEDEKVAIIREIYAIVQACTGFIAKNSRPDQNIIIHSQVARGFEELTMNLVNHKLAEYQTRKGFAIFAEHSEGNITNQYLVRKAFLDAGFVPSRAIVSEGDIALERGQVLVRLAPVPEEISPTGVEVLIARGTAEEVKIVLDESELFRLGERKKGFPMECFTYRVEYK